MNIQSRAGLTMDDIERRAFINGDTPVLNVIERIEAERTDAAESQFNKENARILDELDSTQQELRKAQSECFNLRSVFAIIANQIGLTGYHNLMFTPERWEQFENLCQRMHDEPDATESMQGVENDLEDIFDEGLT